MLRRRSLVPLFSVFFFVFLCCSFAFLLVLFLLKSENRAQATKATQKCTRNQYKKRPSKRQEKKLSKREEESEKGGKREGSQFNRGQCHVQITVPNSVFKPFLLAQWAVPKKRTQELKCLLASVRIRSDNTIKKEEVSNASFIDMVGYGEEKDLGEKWGVSSFRVWLGDDFALPSN